MQEKEERMIENKAELDNWIKDIVAYHKVKRKFVSLKDMQSVWLCFTWDFHPFGDDNKRRNREGTKSSRGVRNDN